MSYAELSLSGESSPSSPLSIIRPHSYERSHPITIPAFHHGEDYRWRRAFGDSRHEAIKRGSLATDMSVFRRVLPPEGFKYNDVQASEAFNDFVRDTGRTVIYITLPPKLRGSQICRDRDHISGGKMCSGTLQSSGQARLIRLGKSTFMTACASDEAYEVAREMQNIAFELFRFRRNQRVERIEHLNLSAGQQSEDRLLAMGTSFTTGPCVKGKAPRTPVSSEGTAKTTHASKQQTEIGVRSLRPSYIFMPVMLQKRIPLKSSPQPSYQALFGSRQFPAPESAPHISDTYPWQSIYDHMNKVGVADFIIAGETVIEKLLPPDAEEVLDPRACTMFDRYIKVTDRDRIYLTVPPLDSDITCQHSDQEKRCSSLLKPWSRAVLHRVSRRTYIIKCLRHDAIEDHANELERQEDDIRLVHQLNQGSTELLFPSVTGDTASSLGKRPLV